MVDNSYQNQDLERLISMAAKFHGIDVPVQAIREEGGAVVITIQGGRELRCKLSDLMEKKEVKTTESQSTQRKPKKKEN